MDLIDAPAPGLYHDVPMWQYNAWDALRSSQLSRYTLKGSRSTLAHIRHDTLAEPGDTDAMALGSAVHCALFEQDKYDERVALGPINPKTSRTYGRTTKKWAEETEGIGGVERMVLLDTDSAAKVLPMAAGAFAHERARELCEAEGVNESSGVALARRSFDTYTWELLNEPATGDGNELLVKWRTDRVAHTQAGAVVVDVKTTRDASESAFRKSIEFYGYDYQAALYRECWRAFGLDPIGHSIIAIENEAPHCAQVYEIPADVMDRAWRNASYSLDAFLDAYNTGEWPGYGSEPVAIKPSEWRQGRIEETPIGKFLMG